jgi:hypothetical protein
MAIDVHSESVISLTDATKLLPRRRAGRKPNVATLYRWTTCGCRGIVLEHLQVGATRCTSREALQRFFDKLTDATASVLAAPVTPLPAGRRREIAAAEKRLARAGI